MLFLRLRSVNEVDGEHLKFRLADFQQRLADSNGMEGLRSPLLITLSLSSWSRGAGYFLVKGLRFAWQSYNIRDEAASFSRNTVSKILFTPTHISLIRKNFQDFSGHVKSTLRKKIFSNHWMVSLSFNFGSL